MDRARAAALTEAWAARHRAADAPSPAGRAGVERLLTERVPDPGAAAALIDADGRHCVAALAGGALYLAWAVAGTPEAARCRRIPLAPAEVEVSERFDSDTAVRHWWFEVGGDPLVFRALDADDEAFAAALATALGWPTRPAPVG
jgi:hypothetical protein